MQAMKDAEIEKEKEKAKEKERKNVFSSTDIDKNVVSKNEKNEKRDRKEIADVKLSRQALRIENNRENNIE